MLRSAATALSNLAAGSQQNKDAIVAAGALPRLVALLRFNRPVVQEKAAKAISNLSRGSQQTNNAILAAGALPGLTALLKSDQPADVQRHVGIALIGLQLGIRAARMP